MPQIPSPPLLQTHQLHTMLSADRAPRLVDVRTPAEFEAAHISGSYNVPLDLLREHRDEFATHLEDVVLICRSGQRAAAAEETLRQAGLSNLHILAGGITEWQAQGFDIRRGTPKWDLERQVRLVSGSIALVAVLASIVVPKAKWVSAAVGAGLAGAAVTNTCAMGMLLARLPYNRGPRCDAESVVRRLADSENERRRA